MTPNEGREFAASDADVDLQPAQQALKRRGAFYKDVKARLAKYGRAPEDLKIMPAVTYVLGDTDDRGRRERRRDPPGPGLARRTRSRSSKPSGAVTCPASTPTGPCPTSNPTSVAGVSQGRAEFRGDRAATVAKWRALAAQKGPDHPELVIEVTGRQSFIGTPQSVADQIDEFVQTDAADGFIFVPHLTPGGLDDLVDKVVPLLQEKGVFRTDYTGPTLRDHLGLGAPRTQEATS